MDSLVIEANCGTSATMERITGILSSWLLASILHTVSDVLGRVLGALVVAR